MSESVSQIIPNTPQPTSQSIRQPLLGLTWPIDSAEENISRDDLLNDVAVKQEEVSEYSVSMDIESCSHKRVPSQDDEEMGDEYSVETPHFNQMGQSEQVRVKIEEPTTGVAPQSLPELHNSESFSFRFKNESKEMSQCVEQAQISGIEEEQPNTQASDSSPIEEQTPLNPSLPQKEDSLAEPPTADIFTQPSTFMEPSLPSLSTPLHASRPISSQWTTTEQLYGTRRLRLPPMRYWLGERKGLYRDRLILTHRTNH